MNVDDFNSIKVLIVDDQPEARALLRNMLSEFGVTQIFEASNGNEADMFMDTAFEYVDMVICDWNMPGKTGLEVLKKMRARGLLSPFLMVTGRADMKSVAVARDMGVNAYIRKPFSPAQLEVKMRVVLQSTKAA